MFKIKQLANEICYTLLLLRQPETCIFEKIEARRKDNHGKLERVMRDDRELKVFLVF